MSTQTNTEDGVETVEVDHSPARASSIAAVGAALVAALTSAPFSILALPVGFGGVAIVAGGLFLKGNRSWVTIGSAGLFLSALISGGFGTPIEILIVSMAATLLAWNLGQHAIGLGEQLGRNVETSRNEAIHGSAALIVSLLAAGLGYLVYSSVSGGKPVAALGVVLLGTVFLVWTIRT